MEDKYIQIKINGVALPTPSEYDIELNDLDAEGQRPITTGKLKRKRIRSDCLKINLVWYLKDFPSISTILNMVKPETFNVTLYDAVGGEIVTRVMYASPKKITYIRLASGFKGEGLSFSLVEV